jgi:diamine N-acetyltransferase
MVGGQSVVLRPFERRHLERTRQWANDPELARLLDRARPVAELEHEQWFSQLHTKTDCLYFAIEVGEQHIGNVWLWGIDWRHRKAELRIVIGDCKCQGRGMGTEAINLMCAYAAARLNLHKIFAYVLSTNPRARRAFEKAGFLLEGTLGEDRWSEDRYIDVYLLGRILSGN